MRLIFLCGCVIMNYHLRRFWICSTGLLLRMGIANAPEAMTALSVWLWSALTEKSCPKHVHELMGAVSCELQLPLKLDVLRLNFWKILGWLFLENMLIYIQIREGKPTKPERWIFMEKMNLRAIADAFNENLEKESRQRAAEFVEKEMD